jgi:hypothetical protein
MPRWLAVLVLLPQCTGCLAYAYPTLTHTPELVVENEAGNAHAFRVDIDRTERKGGPTSTEYTLTRIPLDQRGLVPSQLEVAPVTGIYNPLGFSGVKEHERTGYTMTIRFYRPGSQTVEVKAWDKSHTIQWAPAPGLAAQENAIDDLLADPATPLESYVKETSMHPQTEALLKARMVTWWQLKDQKSPPFGLQPGHVSPSQQKTLLFASSEYSRLASSPPALASNMAATRERLQQKAIWLQRFAVQPPTP